MPARRERFSSFLRLLGGRHRNALVLLLVMGDDAVLCLAEIVGVLRLRRGSLVGLGFLLGVALRGRRGQLGMGRGDGADEETGGEHSEDALHEFSFMCGAPAGTAPPGAPRSASFIS